MITGHNDSTDTASLHAVVYPADYFQLSVVGIGKMSRKQYHWRQQNKGQVSDVTIRIIIIIIIQ